MSNAGLPGTSGFVGEFFVIIAAIKFNLWIGILAATTLILGPLTPFGCIRELCLGNSMNSLIQA